MIDQISRLAFSAPIKGAALLTLAVVCVGCPDGQNSTADAPATAEASDGPQASGALADARTTPNANRRRPEGEGRTPGPTGSKSAYQQAMILGSAALYSGRFEEAANHYLEAMELRPKSMSPALGALRSLLPKGNAEARGNVERIVQRRVDDLLAEPGAKGAAHLLAARMAIALGRPGDALDKAQLAVEQMPELGVSHRVLGEAALVAGRWGEAVASLQRAAALGLEAAPGTWERMADALDELGESKAAEAAARKALALTGSDPHARRRRLNLLAVLLKHRGDLDEANKVASEALELGPNDPAVMHNVASLQEARGKLQEARKTYEAALDVEKVPMTSWRLGHVFLKLELPNEALSAFVEAAAHMDRWTWPKATRWLPPYEVGKLYARGQAYTDAAVWFKDALRESPTAKISRELSNWIFYVEARAAGQGTMMDNPGSKP